jgi:hypothetical protein
MQVGDERFNSNEIQRLYEAVDYPLRKAWVIEPNARITSATKLKGSSFPANLTLSTPPPDFKNSE